MKRKRNVYAIYRGDKFIDVGDANELAERQEITKNTLYFYRTKHYKEISTDENGETYDTRIKVIRLED